MKLTVDVKSNDKLYDDLKNNIQDRFDSVVVGVLGKEGSKMLEIASVQEFGATIKNKGGTSFGFRTKKDLKDNKVRFLKKGKGVFELGKTGPSTITIPARKPIRQTFDKNVDEMTKFMKSLYEKVVDGEMTKRQMLGLVGLKFEGMIKKAISNREFLPNAASTIRAKGHDTPLVNKGRLKASYKHELRKGDARG